MFTSERYPCVMTQSLCGKSPVTQHYLASHTSPPDDIYACSGIYVWSFWN